MDSNPKPTEVQSLIFSKESFKTAEAAKSWAKEHDFKSGDVDETEESFRLRQHDPGEYKTGSFRTIELKEGVKAVIGKRGDAAKEDDETTKSRFDRPESGPRRVNRYDINESLGSPVRLPNGFLKVEGRISRVGVQDYEDFAGKKYKELRLPEDVFDKESMASFRQMPVTNLHPPVLLDANNAKEYTVGNVGENVREDGPECLAATLMITDARAITDAENGRRQLSCGYSCELEEAPGVHPAYGEYDVIQRRIRGNHVALVDTARGGPILALKMDGTDACMLLSDSAHNDKTLETKMAQQIKLVVDGLTLDVVESNIPAIQAAIDRVSASAAKEKTDCEKKVGDLQGRIDCIKAKFDAMKARMCACDECKGSGKVDGVKCDYCDGAGRFRMHDAIYGDATELEVEQETESEAKAAHKDAERADKQAAAEKKRRDSIDRMIARAVKSRVALETEARKHLGEDAKLDGKNDLEVKCEVIKKLSPKMVLDGKSAEYIQAAFDAVLASAPEPLAGSAAVLLGTRSTALQADGSQPSARDRNANFYANAWRSKDKQAEAK